MSLENYSAHVTERARQNIPPLPLNTEQVTELVEWVKSPPKGQEPSFLLDLLISRIPPGVDPATRVKASFLEDIACGRLHSPILDPKKATFLLGTLLGGYNVQPLIQLLEHSELAPIAAKALSHTLLVADAFHDVVKKANINLYAKQVLGSWSNGEWFTDRPKIPSKITATVFKVSGEINTDDLSPAGEAWSRPDIPLHAQAMLVHRLPKALTTLYELKQKGYPIAFVGDVVGTGSSRKSAINSLLWHIGQDIPYVPNKRQGGIILGGKIAPIFFNTAEDSGALPIECDVRSLNMGDLIHIYPLEGRVTVGDDKTVLLIFTLAPATLLDEVRAGGRVPLIIGRSLTHKARSVLSLPPSTVFIRPIPPEDTGKGFTLAQKIVGKACGMPGVRPHGYYEPKITTVGSQDTTGPMTRDELKELACLNFGADFVLQSFCHTAAYPKPVDIETHHTLPNFICARGGVALKPGDGIIHSWLNRMLIPDTVGTGADSHTRFPIGISFPGGSGLVAFAAAFGVMPLDMPESVLVRFKGQIQPGIMLRDLVHAIPYVAIQNGDLTVSKKGKVNIFSGRVLEIEGLPNLKVEQAFEFADAAAERSSNGCTIQLNKEPILEYLQSNIALLKWMLTEGYQDKNSIQKRIDAMQAWCDNPILLERDKDAEYAEVIEIDMNQIREPLLCCPNDPDDVKPLSQVAGQAIEEVFIGSCMTNIGHYRAAGKVLESFGGRVPTTLWIAPPTKMDAQELKEEGYYGIFGKAGVRMEIPGCSLCMGNQARVKDGAWVVSTSTRNFPNRLGNGANVFLSSAEVAAVTAILGKIPTVSEYRARMKSVEVGSEEVYQYLNFHKMVAYQKRRAQ
ncbi:MAG: bifunctional aconitate hydratase 2/2-methylisocitrate dehydratase [Gammaproteobacteria bacterium]|nr:bifunctional aconitate hydratase 2/2-methylisocitrate dehydratase [Gammaproteobacteria bacterium]